MLKGKPLKLFRLGSKRVVVCELSGDNPLDYLDREFAFYAHGQLAGHIRIEGVSTATNAGSKEFDLSYSGDEIFPEQLGEGSYFTDEDM